MIYRDGQATPTEFGQVSNGVAVFVPASIVQKRIQPLKPLPLIRHAVTIGVGRSRRKNFDGVSEVTLIQRQDLPNFLVGAPLKIPIFENGRVIGGVDPRSPIRLLAGWTQPDFKVPPCPEGNPAEVFPHPLTIIAHLVG